MKQTTTDTPQYVNLMTGAGVAAGIYLGMKNNAGFWKSAIYALALGVAGNYAGNMYYKYQNR